MSVRVILLSGLLWLPVGPMMGAAQVSDGLATGSVWSLLLDATNGRIEEPLQLVERVDRRTGVRELELAFEVRWGGRPGRMLVVRGPSPEDSSVTLALTDRSGMSIECQGQVSILGNGEMFGSCSSGEGLWAARWRAVHLTAATALLGQRRRLEEERTRAEDLQAEVDDLRRRLAISRMNLESARTQIANLRGEERGLEVRRMGSFVDDLTGRYYAGGGGAKEESAIPVTFPNPPARNSDLAAWLRSANQALLETLRGLYSERDIRTLRSAESSRCRDGGMFCQIALRQQAVYFALQR